ncbi:MAG: hypothetical protein CMJ46_03730 [Planctomyces sp.]|nr:hypothetical protein [Planctomyces sp.]
MKNSARKMNTMETETRCFDELMSVLHSHDDQLGRMSHLIRAYLLKREQEQSDLQRCCCPECQATPINDFYRHAMDCGIGKSLQEQALFSSEELEELTSHW